MTFQKLFGQDKRIRYLCQDETRLGLKTETGKLITAFGVKPVAPVLWKRDNFWLYGVSQTIDKNGQPCLLDPRSPTTFSDEGCPFLSRFSPRVVEPLSGWHFCQEYAHLNTECFQQFIDTLALQLGEDIALLQMADRRCSCNKSIAVARKFNSGLSACT